MKIALLTTLFPNAQMPSHGVFVENRLRAFLKDHDVDMKVIAPVPWFPLKSSIFGVYGEWAKVPLEETRQGVKIYHPRYFLPPKVGMNYSPFGLERCFTKTLNSLLSQGWEFDLIDAHYFYPDGVAAARVGTAFNKPVVITGRGTDINFIPKFPRQKEMIVSAAKSANSVITVAQALKDELAIHGAPPEKITVLRNGVDLNMFRPLDREKIRRSLSLEGKVVLSVGHLIERKGHNLVIDAIAEMPDVKLLIAGEGPDESALKSRAREKGVSERVQFLERIEHEKLAEIYNAADVLALASSREGWPNVLLEAMACGTPAVATPVWGSGEVIRSPEAGQLSADRTAASIAQSLKAVLDNPPSRKATRRYAEDYSWRSTTTGMAEIFTRLANKKAVEKSLKITPVKLTLDPKRPKLIVTVDTEEQFDWSQIDGADHLVNDPKDIDHFQQLCTDRNIKPVYFLTYPILTDLKTGPYYRNLYQQKLADTGLHLHQWVTPPCQGYQGEYYSFQKNLPAELHKEKLGALAAKFEQVMGFRARSHRAGRYGISPSDYTLLAETGVDYDFSPSAGFDSSNNGGGDFSGFSNHPFSVGVGEDKRVFVTPVCGARSIRFTSLFVTQERNPPGFAEPLSRFKKDLHRPMRLSPEGTKFDDLKALTQQLLKDETPVLSFTLHSTTLTPGASPYAKTHDDVDNLLDKSARYFDYFANILGGEIISLDQVSTLYEKAETSA